jgi:hypothetical protein
MLIKNTFISYGYGHLLLTNNKKIVVNFVAYHNTFTFLQF